MSSIPQIPPTSGEPQQRFFGSDKKLSTPSIFDKIRPLMCSINSTVGESSGFFIGKGTILTVAHNIPMEKVEGKDRFTTDYVQIDSAHQHKPYFPKSSDGIVQEHAKALDLYAIEHEIQLSDLNEIPILSAEIPLKEGMKVYFAGYPLGQDTVTFHKGTISSITENQGIRRFTIDGTVVPGNSGGPVVIQHEGKIYLVGVITSEVADFSPEDQKTIAIMNALSEGRKKQPKPVQSPHSTHLGSNGITRSVQILTPLGTETVQVNDMDTICLALELFQKNLSTGIGKAIDIRHYTHLFQKEPQLQETDNYSFPVRGKGKSSISGTVGFPGNVLAKYVEVRYGKAGRGDRGVRIWGTALGRAALKYKFSPNPHNAPGNYNKNQQELYQNAANMIVNLLIQHQQPVSPIQFHACNTMYTATLDND